MEVRVVDWISYKEGKNFDTSVNKMGGFFALGMRWKDYIEVAAEPEDVPYLEAIRLSVLENKIRYNGFDHQNKEDGVPLFSDGTIASFSFRGWGDLMAAIHSDFEDKNYNYMDFYC